jgi:two-component system, cell cycle response regulator
MSAAEVFPVSSDGERSSGFCRPSAKRPAPANADRIPRSPARDTMPTLVDDVGGPPIQAVPNRDRCVLTVVSGPDVGKLFRIRGSELKVGRNGGAHLDDPLVSRRHARFFRRDGKMYVEDLGSTNGTFRGAEQVIEPQRVEDGDLVGLGRGTLIRVSLLDELSEQALLTMYESSLIDGVTGAFNRRYFLSRLEGEIAFAGRHGLPLSVFLFDIDEFKRINDDYGHDAGDRVLRVIAGSIHRIIRPGDVFARYGGDEFILLARALDGGGAEMLAERIRESVQRAGLRLATGPIKTTLSIGVASRPPGCGATRDQLINSADRAMYRAKAAGRNRVVATIAG